MFYGLINWRHGKAIIFEFAESETKKKTTKNA